MKKKIIFVAENMGSGGAEKSLLSLLQTINYDIVDVDLFLFYKKGLFLNSVPAEVTVLSFDDNGAAFLLPLKESITHYMRSGNMKLLIKRMQYVLKANLFRGSSRRCDQSLWKYMKDALMTVLPEYDAAIGYLEGKPNFFVADCVKAKVKIGYVHSDYRKLEMDKKFDEKIFEKLDYIVGVSDKCADILKEEFPNLKEKIRAVENITSPTVLHRMAEESVAEYGNVNSKILLTVGRIAPPKGYDIAVDAAEILMKNGVDFKWFAIGRGELQAEIEQKIKEKNLEDKFILLGERANPYPYIAGCDIYVQPSYFEGKSIAIDEAKCFAKPIVATKFTTVLDQLADGETAVLAEIDAESVAEKIMQLIADKELCESLSENLKKEKLGNEEEIEKFYEMLGE